MDRVNAGVRVQTMAELGVALRSRRKALGWSQAELARRIHMSRKWVGDAESGKPTLAVEAVLRALAMVGVVVKVSLGPRIPGSSQPGGAGTQTTPGAVSLGDILARARTPLPPSLPNHSAGDPHGPRRAGKRR